MGLKSFNPYTASRRFMTVLDKERNHQGDAEKRSSNRKALRRP